MNLLPVYEIFIDLDDRARQKFPTDKSVELANDIIANGLYHAPVVVRLEEPVTVGDHRCHYKVVAGHRRLIAIRNIHTRDRPFTHNSEPVPKGMTPYTLAQSDDPIAIKEIELHENLIRLDLTWQEKDAAIAQLHELRQSQNPKQTFKDTAQEIVGPDEDPSKQQHRVSQAVTRYKHRDDPDVAAAKTEKEAMQTILRKMEESIQRATVRPKQFSPHRLLHGDAQDLLQRLPDRQFACLISDPPYGIDAHKFGDAAKLRHRYSDTEVAPLYEALFEEAERVLLPDAHIYIFCDRTHYDDLERLASRWGFQSRGAPLIWDKGSRGHLPEGYASGWRRCYEIIFHATRGDRLHTGVANDVIKANWIEEKIHAAQKPGELYYQLLKMSCYANEHVLDPFCGAGPIFRAATQLNLRATGIELDEEWIKHIEAIVRIEREELV